MPTKTMVIHTELKVKPKPKPASMVLYPYAPPDIPIYSEIYGGFLTRKEWLRLERARLRSLGRICRIKKNKGLYKLEVNRLYPDGPKYEEGSGWGN